MKKPGVLLLAVCLAAGLLACGGKEESSGEVKAPEGFVPAMEKETEGVIRVAGHYNNFEALEEEFNRFAEYYPQVEMEYVYLDNYKKVIGTALSGSEAPDIFFTYPDWNGAEDKQEIFDQAENLADASLGIDLSCIREGLLYEEADGSIKSVPVYTTTYGMLVNEDLFEKENLDIPGTYQELLSVCEAFKAAGYASPVMAFNQGTFMTYPLYFPYFYAELQGNETAVSEMNEGKAGAGEYMRSTMELAADFAGYGYADPEICSELENDYQAVIMRFFEGDVPMMMASGNTVSGTKKRESQSEAFSENPFTYSFRPVPSTENGGYFLNTISMGFAVNKNSENLQITNEFLRFLVSTEELNRMAQAKRMVTPCKDMSLDEVYAAFADAEVIYQAEIGLSDAADTQVRKAGWEVSNGLMTVDEAVAAFGTLE